jgi:hypothetical protein
MTIVDDQRREWLLELWERWRRPIRLALSLVGLVAVPYIVWHNQGKQTFLGFDAYSYWTINMEDLFGVPYMDLGAFRYTPAFAQMFAWLALLPWELYLGLILGLIIAIIIYCGRSWALALVAFPPVALEIYHGNIDLFIVASMMIGLRYPVAWVFPFISKVTPGVAILWYVGRRDWRSLGIALAATAVVVGVSFALAPQLWAEWAQVMKESFFEFVPPRRYPIDIPFMVRLPFAVVIALWGGHTNRSWTIPIVAVLTLPIVWVPGLSMLIAIIPLWKRDRAAGTERPTTIGAVTPSTGLLSSDR